MDDVSSSYQLGNQTDYRTFLSFLPYMCTVITSQTAIDWVFEEARQTGSFGLPEREIIGSNAEGIQIGSLTWVR